MSDAPAPVPGAEDRPPPTPVPTDAGTDRAVEPLRLAPLLPRRAPWLLVEVDGSPESQRSLVWALREAARREATVVAVTVLDEDRPVAPDLVDAQVLRAIAETGVHGRIRTAVLDRAVHEALTGAARGADLVVVGPSSKALLRPAVPRTPVRRLARPA
ncbi:universal stress protein [Blastococcus sp. SYSU D00820]